MPEAESKRGVLVERQRKDDITTIIKKVRGDAAEINVYHTGSFGPNIERNASG
jgi:hypothetical protein